MPRKEITDEQIGSAISDLLAKLRSRIREKGNLSYASSHEVLGLLNEEYDELLDAVRNNDFENMREEVLDIAVGALFALACINANSLDWPKA